MVFKILENKKARLSSISDGLSSKQTNEALGHHLRDEGIRQMMDMLFWGLHDSKYSFF